MLVKRAAPGVWCLRNRTQRTSLPATVALEERLVVPAVVGARLCCSATHWTVSECVVVVAVPHRQRLSTIATNKKQAAGFGVWETRRFCPDRPSTILSNVAMETRAGR